MPFEYMWGCIGIGRSAVLTNVTSGGSGGTVSRARRRKEASACEEDHTNGVLLGELELESVNLAPVKRVVVEDFDVHEPFLKVISGDELDAGGQSSVELCDSVRAVQRERE